MYRWFPETPQVPLAAGFSHNQSGMAMVITLIMLLVLTMMGLGIAYVANREADEVAAVVNKPMSMQAGETCFDKAMEWLSTSNGQGWVNGVGAAYDLAGTGGPLKGYTVQWDTVPTGQSDTRSQIFQKQAGQAVVSSCVVEKLSSSTNGSTGNEIGTSNGYGASNFVYLIKITAIGNFNVAMNGSAINTQYWQSNSSRSVLEAVVQYIP